MVQWCGVKKNRSANYGASEVRDCRVRLTGPDHSVDSTGKPPYPHWCHSAVVTAQDSKEKS